MRSSLGDQSNCLDRIYLDFGAVLGSAPRDVPIYMGAVQVSKAPVKWIKSWQRDLKMQLSTETLPCAASCQGSAAAEGGQACAQLLHRQLGKKYLFTAAEFMEWQSLSE